MYEINLDRKLKWNISIMVILVLLACSLIGLLTVIFLNSLISYTDDTYSYHKSYYIAKAWLELALTEIDNSSVWFSQNISSWNIINTNNFDCVWCHFTSHIQWRSSIISNNFWQGGECDEDSALSLDPWESMTIPMFYDRASTFGEIFSEQDFIDLLWKYRMKLTLVPMWWIGQDLNIWVIFQEWSLMWGVSREYLYMTWLSMNNNIFYNYFIAFQNIYDAYVQTNYYPYIIISNPNESKVKFCIKSWEDDTEKQASWPTTKYFISSIGEYMGKTVWLQAIYAQPIPSFFINPYSY